MEKQRREKERREEGEVAMVDGIKKGENGKEEGKEGMGRGGSKRNKVIKTKRVRDEYRQKARREAMRQ